MSENVFVYVVNKDDIIVSVGSNWLSFACDNGWRGTVSPENVEGRSLWDFIQDPETLYLYQELFRRLRDGNSVRPVPFRCDSPRERRFLELSLKTMQDGQIEITSRILYTESRSHISLLDADTPRSEEFIRICSMCKKINAGPDQWIEIDEALDLLSVFDAERVPMLSHGMCPQCFQTVMNELDDF